MISILGLLKCPHVVKSPQLLWCFAAKLIFPQYLPRSSSLLAYWILYRIIYIHPQWFFHLLASTLYCYSLQPLNLVDNNISTINKIQYI
ncbi:hypothetical protein AQUCO_07100016v1 [Aquilegia coerulea]|uniref:Uncharacterized protein n=1 Tax=Aquilegia coerulea TaxID=218851 RepID=A0A2G5CAR2_AQUCA|nr:hypothetical protein AQUCO_07100016v1 [Aquilegia coerulea]